MANLTLSPHHHRSQRRRQHESRYDHDPAPKRYDALWSLAGVVFLTVATSVLIDEEWPGSVVNYSEAAESTAPGAILIPPKPNYAALTADIEAAPLTRDDVRRLQTRLDKMGYAPGATDGIAGGRTLEALNAYRESENLPAADRVDYGTVAGLLE